MGYWIFFEFSPLVCANDGNRVDSSFLPGQARRLSPFGYYDVAGKTESPPHSAWYMKIVMRFDSRNPREPLNRTHLRLNRWHATIALVGSLSACPRSSIFWKLFKSRQLNALPPPTSKERACARILLTAEKVAGKQHVLANILRVFGWEKWRVNK